MSDLTQAKLTLLMEHMGVSSETELMDSLSDGEIDAGICMSPDCDTIAERVEPDQTQGLCWQCGRKEVCSATELLISI